MPLRSIINGLLQFRSSLDTYLRSNDITEQITIYKRSELMEGKRGDGSDITPKYDDIPEFRGWYVAWKKTLDSYALNGTPDLYIDGTFHNSLFTEFKDYGIYQTQSDNSKAFMIDVVKTHDNGTLLDLTTKNKKIIGDQIYYYFLRGIKNVFH